MTDLCYAITEKGRSAEQHGYMKNRGAWSATLKVIELLKEGKQGYEFDLKSFFNTVNPYIVWTKLEQYSKTLKLLITSMIRKIEYRYVKLEDEAELKAGVTKEGLIRYGLPQGLSLSPLLATLSLEYLGRPTNVIMYADDGIYFHDGDTRPFIHWMNRLKVGGITLALEKSGDLQEEFTFCGFTVNQKLRTVTFGESHRN